MQSVLVTGATGFIGRHLCQQLQTSGIHVTAVGRSRSEGPWDDFVCADLGGWVSLPVFVGIDTVFHLAGKAHALAETSQDERSYFQINVEGTRQLLEWARKGGVPRFVLFSSIKAVGEGGFECLDEKAPCYPRTPYGASKLKAEELVLRGGYVPEPVVLRLSMVYGPSEKGNLPRMIRAVQAGRFPPLPEVGNRRSMAHVDDVVQAAMLAAEKSEAISQTYLVTDGTPYSTRQIYEWVCEALGKPSPAWSIPLPLLRLLARMGDGIGCLCGRRFVFDTDAMDKLTGSACYSSRRIERELGFSAHHHLHDSLPEIVHFLGERKT